jgi:hypothetical protein
MVDHSHIGRVLPPTTHEVEAGRLRFFAKSTVDSNPVFRDMQAAQVAGYPSIPAPPTFSFCLEMDRDDPFDYLDVLGIDIAKLLHAEQSFIYHAPIYASDKITFTSKVSDIVEKKGGALTFVTINRNACKADGSLAVELRMVLVVRNG